MMLSGRYVYGCKDRTPAFAQLMSVYCKQLSQFYILADQYCLKDLKDGLTMEIKWACSYTWNHSTILEAFELLLNSTQTEDSLNAWILDQIKLRFFVLLREPQFTKLCTRVPQLHLAKNLAHDGYMQQKNDKTLRYCHNMAPFSEKFCHRNVSTKWIKRGEHMCTVCGSTDYIGPARERMWPDEGEAEPELDFDIKHPKKIAKKRRYSVFYEDSE